MQLCCMEVALIRNPFLACAERSLRLYPTWSKIKLEVERELLRASLPGGFSIMDPENRTRKRGEVKH